MAKSKKKVKQTKRKPSKHKAPTTTPKHTPKRKPSKSKGSTLLPSPSKSTRPARPAKQHTRITHVLPETAERRRRQGLPPKHPNSLKNLKPRKPGDPALNPSGRPKGSVSLNTLLRKVLSETPSKHTNRMRGEIFIRRCVAYAMGGDSSFAKMIYERAEGPVVQKHEVQGNISGQHEHEIARRVKAKLDELREELRREAEDEQEGK